MITIEVPKDGSRLPLSRAPRLQKILFTLTLLGTIYAGVTRHWSDFLLYVPLCAAPAILGLSIAIGRRLWLGERSKNLRLGVTMLGIVFLFVGLFYYGLIVSGKDFFRWIDPKLTSPVSRAAFFSIVALVVGSVLFFVRSFARAFYGFHEALVGIFIAGYNAYKAVGFPSSWDSGVYLALVTAGVYLVVRGLDNIQVGITKEPYDPFGRDLFRDYFDKKDDPRMVKLSMYLSDVFFARFPEFPTGSEEPPGPRVRYTFKWTGPYFNPNPRRPQAS
ncbi:hypothetical protein QTH91_17090 [Variovorax dokdonensis]|uniref:Uncharacterized protein n=1 Tax=Variovorax dokdonensis TaxID=344883 RepID=A0ABT7NEC3_9BURK|nr:hypothetical protein [Variovorax dokdonensis]MDM0046210.1 hypothetical protein [Variovorax dokdonensis]